MSDHAARPSCGTAAAQSACWESDEAMRQERSLTRPLPSAGKEGGREVRGREVRGREGGQRDRGEGVET